MSIDRDCLFAYKWNIKIEVLLKCICKIILTSFTWSISLWWSQLNEEFILHNYPPPPPPPPPPFWGSSILLLIHMRFRSLITSNSIKWVHVSAKVQWGSVCSKVNVWQHNALWETCWQETLLSLFSLGVLDLKRRSAEWSVYDIKVPRELFESIRLLSYGSRGTVMSSSPAHLVKIRESSVSCQTFVCDIFSTYSYITQNVDYIYWNGYFWMNEWMMHLYSAFYDCCTPKALYNHVCVCGGSPQPPPVCSIHLDDATAATGQRAKLFFFDK